MTLRLRTKLSLAFLLVTLVPLTITVTILFAAIKAEFHSDFERDFSAVKASVGQQYRRHAAELNRKLQSLKTEPAIRTALLDMRSGTFYNGEGAAEKQRRFHSESRQLMRSIGVGVLKILDGHRKGMPIAFGHLESFGLTADAYSMRMAMGFQGQPFLRFETVWRDKQQRRVLTLQVARPLRKRLVAIGGVLVNNALIRSLRGIGAASAIALLDARRAPLYATVKNPLALMAGTEYKRGEIPLINPGAKTPVAYLAVFLSKHDLNRNIDNLLKLAVVLAAIGLVLSLVLGYAFARAISHPVQELAQGAEQIAEGKWDVRIRARSRDEIGELVHAFNRMAGELGEYETKLRRAERIAAWQEMARQIAHEIKNPLFPIQTSIETLRKAHQRRHQQFEEIFDESTLTVLEEVKRLKHIVQEFGEFARLPKPTMAIVQLNGVLDHVLSLYRGIGAEITVKDALDPDLPPMHGDEKMLNQVFINLLKNATEALVDGRGEILVRSFTMDGGRVAVEIRDSGAGIAVGDEEEIFKPYFSRKTDGTGLGLSIVHRIVTDHGGRIEVESINGEGTCFRLIFPPSL